MKNNLHLFISDLTLETRLFKESQYCYENNIAKSYALGKNTNKLNLYEVNEYNLFIYRVNFIKFIERRYVKVLNVFILLVNLLIYSFKAYLIAKKIKANFIVIHNSGLLPIGKILTIILSIQLVYQPHELESKKSGNTEFINLITLLIEKIFLSLDTKCIVVCKPIEEWYKKNLKLIDVNTVRNVPDKYQISTIKEFELKSFFDNSNLIFIYQGLVSKNRGCERLIEVCKKNEINLVIMGHLDNTIKSFDDRFVKFVKPVPKNEIISMTSSADIGLHINNDDSISYEYSLPNKFFEYMHAGIPIIVSTNMSYLSNLVKSNNLGWVINYNDFENLILSIQYDDVLSLKKSIRSYSKKCKYEIDAKIFNEVYK